MTSTGSRKGPSSNTEMFQEAHRRSEGPAVSVKMAGLGEARDRKVGKRPNHRGWLDPQAFLPPQVGALDPRSSRSSPDAEMLSSGLRKRQPEAAGEPS